MEQAISEKYRRELDKRERRKAELGAALEDALAGVERIVFEPGCGHGHWLTDYAAHHTGQVCVGIDLISMRVRKALQKRDKQGLPNLFFFKAELNEFLEALPERIRIESTVFLFPDPWPKARHHRRRMIQTGILHKLADRTDSGGLLCFRTDDAGYFEWTIECLQAHPAWEILKEPKWPHESETYFQGLMDSYKSLVAKRQAAPTG
ncbi:MAG: tRNA (guanosine(46)-N7)-methyltransferase TrmB [Opitutales bacterium]